MTSAQQKAAAADMLTGARNKGDGGEGLPSDALIQAFWGDVSEGCSPIGCMSLAEAGAMAYLIGRAPYAP